MSAHGPDLQAFEGATEAELAPERYKDTMAFMFETCRVIHPTRDALDASERQTGYQDCWAGLKKHFDPTRP